MLYEEHDDALRAAAHPDPVRETPEEKEEFVQEQIKPKLCQSLDKIGKECKEELDKCFTREDANQVRAHLDYVTRPCDIRRMTV